jgi:protein-tyrosine-phosphatase
MHIHFVCSGNSFRSRFAEAYIRSKQIKNILVSSSGTGATKNICGAVSWLTQRYVIYQGLIPYITHEWQQTTSNLLKSEDKIIFMQKKHHKYCVEKLGYNKNNYEIWEIGDLVDYGFTDSFRSFEDDLAKIKKSEEVFAQIKKKIDTMMEQIHDPAYSMDSSKG